MTLSLPNPFVDDLRVQQNFERISLEWPQPASNWTAYTPTVTNTSVTLGTGGSNTGRYQKSGRTVRAYGSIVLGTGGAFTGASDISIALPFASGASTYQVGQAAGLDYGTSWYSGFCLVNPSTSVLLVRLGSTPAALTATAPFTWADGDILFWNLVYEAAL